MADDTMKENPLLKTLLAQGADTAMIFKGYVGAPTRKGYVRFYPRLGDLSQSIEVAQADIIHSAEEPKSAFGSRVFWVKKDADVVVHRVETPAVTAGPQAETREVTRGRLRIRVRLRSDDDTCASLCSCETCQCTCASFNPIRTLKK